MMKRNTHFIFKSLIGIGLLSTVLIIFVYDIRKLSLVLHVLLLLIGIITLLSIKFSSPFRELKSVCYIIALIALGGVILNPNTFGIGSLIELAYLLCMMMVLPQINVDSQFTKLILFGIAFFYLIYSLVGHSEYNSNNVSFAFFYLGALSSMLINIRKKWGLVLFLFLAVVVFIQIAEYRSRSCMVGWLFYCFLCILPTKYVFKRKIVIFLITLSVTFGSLVFARIYVYLYDNNLIEATEVEMMDDSGKRIFTGREYIWGVTFEGIKENPIFGFGSNMYSKTFEGLGIHNAILEIFGIFGVIVGFLVIYMIFMIVMSIRPNIKTDFEKRCLAFFFALMLGGFGETTLLHRTFDIFLPLAFAYASIRERNLYHTDIQSSHQKMSIQKKQ